MFFLWLFAALGAGIAYLSGADGSTILHTTVELAIIGLVVDVIIVIVAVVGGFFES